MPVALVTGASQGLGLALTTALARRDWQVTVDARDGRRLGHAVDGLPGVTALPGDVTSEAHRRALVQSLAHRAEPLDLLVLNASFLGASPLPLLMDYPVDVLRQVYEVNLFAPLALVQLLLRPLLRAPAPVVLAISSDAAVEAYAGWGGYGSSKAALDQLVAVLGVEHPTLRAYAVDPGDMRTAMHQQAFPDEDISDRPVPGSVVPALLRLLDTRPPSGRYRAAGLVAA